MNHIKSIRNHITRIAIIAMGLIAAQCGDGASDGPANQYLQQIVTFTGNLSGGNVGFEYRAIDDSPLISLTARGHINEKAAKPGDRLLLTYMLGPDRNPKEGGEVDVVGLEHVLTDTVETAAAEPASLGGLYLLTIQRSGEYLDIMAQMAQTTKRKITVSCSAEPDAEGLLNLWIDASDGEGAEISYNAPTWASLWIGPAWQRQQSSGVRVIVNNTNNPYRNEFIFRKKTL